MSGRSAEQFIFLFSDIESSTSLWERYPNEMQRILALHDQLVTRCIENHDGRVIKHTGDGFFTIFDTGTPLDCALEIQCQIALANWAPADELRIRLALHSGTAEKRGEDYFGVDINRTARLLSAGWGGQILLTDDVLKTAELPEGSTLEDFGKHLLKDLGEPQHIYGLLGPALPFSEFPPLRTLSQRNHNLPTQTTPFVGRERELEEIQAHISDTPCRLLTLAGPGGMGKTRLALQAAAVSIDSFRDGVFFVPLASIEHAELVVTSIAASLGFNFYEEKDTQEQLLDFLENKEMLLILDNFEHVIEATPIVAEVLGEAPNVKMIVTSRERLQIQGEWVYPILGLTYPQSGVEDISAESYGAVHLFLEGARRANPAYHMGEQDTASIIRICQLVQGMPLGVELASAWMGVLPVEEIASEIERNQDFLETEMHGVPERHRSLRAVFEYSWNLLADAERETFSKLSVFRGGFSRAAAAKVANTGIKELERLLSKSLIRRDEQSNRYVVIDALLEYADEKLADKPELARAVQLAHAKYFLSLVHEREAHLKGPQQKSALLEIGVEIENIRKAWSTAYELQQWNLLEEALSALALFYEMRSWFLEGEEMFNKASNAIETAGHASPEETQVAARILTRQAVFSHRLGNSQFAEELLKRSLKLQDAQGDNYELALLYNNLGNIAFTLGDTRSAFDHHEKSLELRVSLGDAWTIATSLSNLGVLEARQGHHERARELFEASLEHRRAIEDRFGIATSLNNLGVIASELGEYERARSLHKESLEIRRELEDQKGITESLSNLGVIADALGEYDDSISLYEESLSISEAIGDKYASARTLNNLGYAAYNLGEYEYALQFCQKALRLNREILNKSGIVLSLNGMANSESELRQFDSAEKHFLEALRTSASLSKNIELLEILLGLGLLNLRRERHRDAARILRFLLAQENADVSVQSHARELLNKIGEVDKQAHDESLTTACSVDELIDSLSSS